MEISEIEKIGLSKRESEIYMALLQKKEFTAAEIASITDVTRTKVYEILQNLEIKGLCTGTQRNNRKQYRAIDPKIAFQNIISQDEKKLNTKKEIANQLGEDLHSLFKKNNYENNPLDYVEILNDNYQIYSRCIEIQQNTTEEILAFTKSPYTKPLKPFQDYLNGELDALKKGVKIKSIYEYRDISKKELKNIVDNWIAGGEEARIVEELPIKMAIFDNRITMISLNDPIPLKSGITAMIVIHEGFAKTMKNIFDSIWEKAMSFDEFKIKEKI